MDLDRPLEQERAIAFKCSTPCAIPVFFIKDSSPQQMSDLGVTKLAIHWNREVSRLRDASLATMTGARL